MPGTMKSKAFAIKDSVWMRLARTPDGSQTTELEFASIVVAEELAQAVLSACAQARQYLADQDS